MYFTMKKLGWFSLVELIVVVTIIAILATISYINLLSYGWETRDARRMADIWVIISWVEEIRNDKWYYELPDDGFNITYSWWVVWRQWVFGYNNTRAIGPSMWLSKAPVDPLSGNNYTYSVLNTRKEFQLAVALEWGYDDLWLVSKANAGDRLAYTYINGNYNGKIAKVTIEDVTYILAVPTIINNDVSDDDLLSIIQNAKLAYNWSDFLPWSYANTVFDLDGDWVNDPIVNFEEVVVYEWDESWYDPLVVYTNIQEAYSWVTAANDSIEEIVLVDVVEEPEIVEDFVENTVDDIVDADEVIEREIVTTIYCLDKAIWEEFVEDGITYKVVDNSSYTNWIKRNLTYIDDTHNLCTSHVTSMADVFKSEGYWSLRWRSLDISSWDTSNVTSMHWMFSWTYGYLNNIYIWPYWDTSKVEDMSEMFFLARSRRDFSWIENWDTSSVTNMSKMFMDTDYFDQDISWWDTSKVEDMSSMFNRSEIFNQDISWWDVSSVTNMASMFADAELFDYDLSTWDTSKVTNMSHMFYSYSSYAYNNWWEALSFDTSNVENMSGMFYWAENFNQNINWLNTSKVKNMYRMFQNSWFRNSWLPLTIDTSSVENMSRMFEYSWFNSDISNLDTSSVTNMSRMFYWNRSFNQDISSWDVSNVTNMSEMFSLASSFDQNLSSWDVSNVVTMEEMFSWDWRPQYDYSFNNWWQPLTWNTSSLEVMKWMFSSNDYFNQDVSSFDISRVTDLSWVFSDAFSFDNWWIPLNSWDTSSVTNFSWLFNWTSFNQDISSWNTSSATSMASLFNSSSFNQDISSWNVSNVLNMNYMFSSTPFNQDISSWNVSWVDYMQSMFSSTPFNQDISSWDVSWVLNMEWMFNQAYNFNQDISSWDISSNSSLLYFLAGTPFNYSINNWDISSVTNMDYLFLNASNFNQPLDNWNTWNVTSMRGVFWWASSFNQPLNSWDTWNVEYMDSMFRLASSFNQPLNGWDTDKVIKMTNMFTDASSFDSDISTWNLPRLNSIQQMFLRATNFDQDLSSWYAPNMVYMQSAFEWATSFSWDLSNWCVSRVSREPYRFLYLTISWNDSSKKPVWWTCPSGS